MNIIKFKASLKRKYSAEKSFFEALFMTGPNARNKVKPSLSVKLQMKSKFGENRVIADGYDEKLSVSCSNGIFVGTESDTVISFKGIPFAKPPIGNLRWKAPQKPEKSSSVREAKYFGPSPIQSELFSERASCYPQSEDCLYLNVWCSEDKTGGKPVMVFIHGGSYGWGGTSDPLYDGTNFVKENPDIILVTIAYRLGIMGFMNFSSVEGGDNFKDGTNLGLLDQICALEWIRDNIAGFGGDPGNVTVFGESAGGGSVCLLPLIKKADGLFTKVIAESGSVVLSTSAEDSLRLTNKLMKKTKSKNMDDLMSLSFNRLKQVNDSLNDSNNFPIRDGTILPLDPYKAYSDGNYNKVDMIIGTNADESRYWIKELGGERRFSLLMPVMFENNLKVISKKDSVFIESFASLQNKPYSDMICEFNNEMLFRLPALETAINVSKTGNKAYVYYWTAPSSIGTLGACHAVELAYVFNNPKENIYTGDYYDSELGKRVRKFWTDFARFGSPAKNGSWPEYGNNRSTMIFGREDNVEIDPKSGQRILLYPILRYYFNGCYSNLDLNVPYIYGALLAMITLIAFPIVWLVKKIKLPGGKKNEKNN